MHGTLTGNRVHVESPARERFYDNRGYGHPAENGALDLTPVEAAHLLYRDDLNAVDEMGLREFLSHRDLAIQFAVYTDLRERGYYLTVTPERPYDFVVHPRGKGPWDDEIAHLVRVVDERELIRAQSFSDNADTFAIVDEEGEISYFEITQPTFTGDDDYELPHVTGQVVANRVLVWNPPDGLHEQGFFGQRLYGRHADTGPLQLSLVEAAYLETRGRFDLQSDRGSIVERGHALNDQFDQRLYVYNALREQGVIPKTGFKFGADFRTYASFDDVEAMKTGSEHSERLVRVIPPDHEFATQAISQDVRLASGVNKEMVFALTDATEIEWHRFRWFSP
jgi:tRNA-intron endonuclease